MALLYKYNKLLLVLSVFACQCMYAQTNNKITGPLGVYHIAPGNCYADSTGTTKMVMQYQYRFGEMAIANQAIDNYFDFVPELDSCISWNANRVVAIIQPPTEHGVPNKPSDNALFSPVLQIDGPGMVQGGQRFSRLSKLYGGICGVILDDYNGDVPTTKAIHDAVQGKYVDPEGNVDSESEATTPNNKLYTIIYSTAPIPDAMPYIDGVQFYQVVNQNCCLGILDSNITALRANFPGKEIQIGIYLKNSGAGWLQPAGVQYTLAHSLNRYDDGDINGITLFAGIFLIDSLVPLNIYNSFNLPHWLDSLYYPNLGAGQGKLYDCTNGNALTDGFVRVYCKGRVSGDTLFRSRQKTDANGNYHFGLWAGNRNTDSTYYWLVAEKPGYKTDTVGFWIKRADTTGIPSLALCPVPDTSINVQEHVQLYPNPTTGNFVVLTQQDEQVDGVIEIYNMLGQKVYSAPRDSHYSHVSLNEQESGVYVVVVRTGNRTFSSKHKLVLQH